jgi:hypothetical protein
MYMELGPSARRADPELVSSYQAFQEWLENSVQESELHRFQKYNAIKKLLKSGLNEVYVNPPVIFLPNSLERRIDACGFGDDKFTTVLCEAGVGKDAFFELLELLGESTNVESVWVYPLFDSKRGVYRKSLQSQSRGKLMIEMGTLEHLEDFLEGALEILDLFESEARRTMLLAMLDSPRDKRFFRELVNPKLLYENLATLQRIRLVEKVSGGFYGLSRHGENLMREYLLFLDRIRRVVKEREEI